MDRYNFYKWLNSDKPFNLLIWTHFSIVQTIIIIAELKKPTPTMIDVNLYIVEELPAPYAYLFLGALMGLFISHFNKLLNKHYKQRK